MRIRQGPSGRNARMASPPGATRSSSCLPTTRKASSLPSCQAISPQGVRRTTALAPAVRPRTGVELLADEDRDPGPGDARDPGLLDDLLDAPPLVGLRAVLG